MSVGVPWTDAYAYSNAIQNPQNCFENAVLKNGRVVVDGFGQPTPSSGNFAVVFRVEYSNSTYAVKCFVRAVTTQERRYNALSLYIANKQLPMLVDFKYLSRGILVSGNWYPAVRMEWAPGESLTSSISKNVTKSSVLHQLSEDWRSDISILRANHIAHGDLQHGNIKIEGNKFLLVDYDGCYIPTLANDKPGENGHKNYQHPERIRDGYYRESMDNFSVIVIYHALVALAADPGLWDLHGGENLILAERDFLNPGGTPAWDRLYGSPEPKVRALTAILDAICGESVSSVPDLENALRAISKRPGSVPQPLSKQSVQSNLAATKSAPAVTQPPLVVKVPSSSSSPLTMPPPLVPGAGTPTVAPTAQSLPPVAAPSSGAPAGSAPAAASGTASPPSPGPLGSSAGQGKTSARQGSQSPTPAADSSSRRVLKYLLILFFAAFAVSALYLGNTGQFAGTIAVASVESTFENLGNTVLHIFHPESSSQPHILAPEDIYIAAVNSPIAKSELPTGYTVGQTYSNAHGAAALVWAEIPEVSATIYYMIYQDEGLAYSVFRSNSDVTYSGGACTAVEQALMSSENGKLYKPYSDSPADSSTLPFQTACQDFQGITYTYTYMGNVIVRVDIPSSQVSADSSAAHIPLQLTNAAIKHLLSLQAKSGVSRPNAGSGSLPAINPSDAGSSAQPSPSPSPSSTVTPGAVLYQADWSNGLNGWPSGTGWKVTAGMYVNDGSDYQGRSSDAPYNPGDFGIDNYAVEAEVQHLGNDCEGDYGLHARGNSNSDYVFDIRNCNSTAAITRWSPENRLTEENFTFGSEWHLLRIEVRGSKLTFFIDGKLVASATDTTYLHGGATGVQSWKSRIAVRAFRIVAL